MFHDAGVYDASVWNDLVTSNDLENIALDHHYYQVRGIEGNTTSLYVYGYNTQSANADNFKFPVWFGEWAISTDICTQWLESFNDGYTEFAYYGRYCINTLCP